MSLDKLTLHHQLAIMANSLTSLDATLKQRIEEHKLLGEEIARLHGARSYHTMIVDQVNATLAAIDKEAEDRAATVPPVTT